MDIEVVSGLGPDGQIQVANDSGLPMREITGSGAFRELASQLSRWVDRARSATNRTSMFDRGVYTPPENPYDEMRAARNAMRYDDIVSGVAEITEAYAFQGTKWESPEPDEGDVFNQLAAEQNLDGVMRSMWREEYGYSQTVAGKIWGWREYQVRGKTQNGNARKRTFKVWAPVQIRTIDVTKTVPVGTGPFAGEQLAWQATPYEIGQYTSAFNGERVDPLMLSFFSGEYNPDIDERTELVRLGVQPDRLLLMNSDYVFRHTLTKADYERFPDVRLKSCFKLLDLKQQLINADRAMLIGAANYILLIRKGDEKKPATGPEIENLKENYSFITKLPVIISDHRLQIDIIAPKTDVTLSAEKYDVIDARLLARLLGTLTVSTHGSGRETQDTLGQSVARVMESRRHMMRRTIEREIGHAVVNHPKNKGVFKTVPSLIFTPRNIALALDPAYVQSLLALRTQREISRETILEYFGLDEATEAMRMEIEADLYDHVFMTQIPFAAANPAGGGAPATKDGPNTDPNSRPASGQPASGAKKTTPNGTPEAPAVSGARGGRPAGGGKSAKSPQKIAKPRTSTGAPSTKKA